MTQQDAAAGAAGAHSADLHQRVLELQRVVGDLQKAAHAPESVGPAPTGVLIGVGSDPLALGLPAFLGGFIAVGLALVGFLPATALGGVIPEILLGSAFFMGLAALWAILLGQSLVATIFGVFSAFSFGLSALLLGLFHSWFAVPVAAVPHVETLFLISWGAVFVALAWPLYKLPAVYGVIITLVVVAVGLLAAAFDTGNAHLLTAGGAAVLAFDFFGMWAWLNVTSVATGGADSPPLGPPLRK